LVELENGIKLQPKAKENYLKMLEAAKTEGVVIGVVSGYRSQEDQNTIFKPRLEALEMAQLGGYYTPEEFLTGQADEIIKQSMALTAPPGYSRHQTGYTVDLSDQTPDNTTTVFKGSKADIWLSKDNYANARRFGFIPSYPVGQQNIGPEPEPWEYVWVGNKAQ
jgi:D-alanyl-D-alanine carboxypeptidase